MASKNLSDTQKQLVKTMDAASQLVVDYAGAEVPPLNNLTPEGLLEDFGRLNEARKAIDKTEKVVRARFESQLGGAKELRGDNFTYKKATSERTALNQTAAKEKLAELGLLEDYMETTEVERVTVKRN